MDLCHDNLFDESPSTENVLLFEENTPDLALIEFNPHSYSGDHNEFGDHGIGDVNDPLSDPIYLGIHNSSQERGNYEFSRETGSSSGKEIPQTGFYSEFGNWVEMSIWPVPPVPYSCTYCQVLREITHTNGVHVTKLEIHGRLGMICHAILENRYGGDRNAPSQHQMFDFSKKSIESVRELLTHYCHDRKLAGYTMLQDPFLTFYQALCVGMMNGNDDDTLDDDIADFLQTSPLDSGEYQPEPVNQVGPEIEVRNSKSSLAQQRERTGRLTLRDFAGYCRLPIDDAARKMNICPTVMKKICRKHGLFRWPYRKIRSIERQISNKRASLNESDGVEEKARVEADIQALEEELAAILAVFNH